MKTPGSCSCGTGVFALSPITADAIYEQTSRVDGSKVVPMIVSDRRLPWSSDGQRERPF